MTGIQLVSPIPLALAIGVFGCATIAPAVPASSSCPPSEQVVEVRNSVGVTVEVYGHHTVPMGGDVRQMTFFGTAPSGTTRFPLQGMTHFRWVVPGDSMRFARADGVSFRIECAAH